MTLVEKTPIRVTTVVLAVMLIIIFQSIAVFSVPGADPLARSETFAELSEGYWYLSQARAWLYGHEDNTPASYRYPLLTVPQYLFFSFTGLSTKTAALPMGLSAVAVTLLLLLLTFRRFGPRAAVLVGWLICLEPFWNEQARRPHPYPLIALWMLLALSIGCSESRGRRLVGLLLTVVGGLWLHPLCGLALPWLVHNETRRALEASASGSRWLPWSPFVLSVSAGFGAALWFVHCSNATIEFAHVASFAMTTSAPIVTLWGAVGAVLGWVEPARIERDADFDHASTLTVFFIWILLAITGSSSAAYALTIPFLVHHATLLTERVLGWAQRGRRAMLGSRIKLGAIGIGSIGIVFCAFLLTVRDLETSVHVGTVIALAGVVFTLLLPLLPRTIRTGWCSGGAVALAGAIWIPTWLLMFGSPTYSHANSSRQLRAVLLPTATLAGPAAAAMGIENELMLVPSATSVRDSTHWISDAAPAQLPPELAFVEVFHPVAQPIRVYRSLDSNGQRSAFEEGVILAQIGEAEKAEEMFLAVLKGFEDTGCAWTRLGMLLYRTGNSRGAYQCFLNAIQEEPSRVGAHVVLASLYLNDGRLREAMTHLQRALDHEPSNAYLRREVELLRARLK